MEVDPEQRVIELEIKLSYQEQRIADLDETLLAQGRRIDELEDMLRAVRMAFERLRRQGEGGEVLGAYPDEDPVPSSG